jgi:hypothetical protein
MDGHASGSSGLLKPKADQAAYNFTQAGTTYHEGSMAGTDVYADDGRTDVSTYSYRSGLDVKKYLKEAYGRVAYNGRRQT